MAFKIGDRQRKWLKKLVTGKEMIPKDGDRQTKQLPILVTGIFFKMAPNIGDRQRKWLSILVTVKENADMKKLATSRPWVAEKII